MIFDIIWYVLWLSLLTFLFSKYVNFLHTSLNKKYWVYLFLSKTLGAALYGIVYFKYYRGGDTLGYYYQGLRFYKIIQTEGWATFLRIITQPNIGKYPESSIGKYYAFSIYWTNNGSCLLSRINALLHFISFQNYFVHSLFFALISTIGLIFFYKGATLFFPHLNKLYYWFLLCCPSLFFWASGIHKEAIMILLLGYVFYCFCKLNFATLRLSHIIFLVLSLLILYYIRSYACMLMLPPLIAWFWQKYQAHYPWIKNAVVYFVCIMIVWISNSLVAGRGLIYKLVSTQKEFIENKGQSVINSQPMEPSLLGAIQFFPKAFINAFFRPFITDHHKPIIFLQSFEVLFYHILLLLIVLFAFNKHKLFHPVVVFIVAYVFTYAMLLGYAVNTFGALVRYKSVVMPLFILVLLVIIDINKVKGIASKFNIKF